MGTKRGKIIILFLLTILISCYKGNEIFFNINEQTLYTKDNKRIYKLYIIDFDNKDEYVLKWCNDKKYPPKSISINDINKSYCIYRGWQRKKINSFKLNSNCKYRIDFTQGDASSYKIDIFTDNDGYVYKVLNPAPRGGSDSAVNDTD